MGNTVKWQGGDIYTAELWLVLSYGMKTTNIERKNTNGDYSAFKVIPGLLVQLLLDSCFQVYEMCFERFNGLLSDLLLMFQL